MQSRSLRILLIGVFSLWFGIIVPGHERGAIRVAGANAQHASAGESCHTAAPTPTPSCGHCPINGAAAAEGDASDPSPVDPGKHCAICKFIGVLDAPVIITFDLPRSFELATLEPLPVHSIASLTLLSSHRDRGPPILFV